MVQILERQPTKFEQLIGGISQGLGGLTEGAQALKGSIDQRKTRHSLARQFGDEFKNIRDPNILKLMTQSKLNQEEQRAKLAGEYEADAENYERIKNAFGDKFAEVWLASPTGARTALTQAALEAKGRGIDLDQMLGLAKSTMNPETSRMQEQSVSSPEQQVAQELQNLRTEQDEGLLPAERIARGKERYSTGLKEYQEAGAKLRNFARDKERLDILESLEKGDKLPKGLGRINLDKEGNLKLSFLGSKEAQRYVKTLNEFSSGAKDTFGSRVTNFDLAQYLRRFPTLLNTAEGRKQLYQQMRLVNQINSIYYKNLKKVYDDAGGVRNIDSDAAERLAEQLSEPRVNELSKKFLEIGDFASRPSPSEFKGKKIRDKETGEVFVSDGQNWIPQ